MTLILALSTVLSLSLTDTAPADAVYPHRSGVIIAWSPAWDTAWSSPDGNGYKVLDRMKADGFNQVDFQIYNSQGPEAQLASTLVNKLDDPARRALYVRAIEYAHSIGLRVSLKPHVGGAPQTISYFPPDPAKFFDAYKSMLDSVAVLADETDAEMIVIGTELGAKLSSNFWKDQGNTTFDVTTWWRETMIPSVRAKAPRAELTYAASSTPHLHADVNASEAPHIDFWDLLDHIGLDGYFNVNDIATRLTKSPLEVTEDDFHAAFDDNGLAWARESPYIDPVFSMAALRAKTGAGSPDGGTQDQMRYFQHIAEGIYALYGAEGTRRRSTTLSPRAIFTEWGVPGTVSSLGFWGENEGSEPAWELQRRGYAAAMREFKDQMDDGAGAWFAGIAIWQILPWHNPDNTTRPESWVTDFDPIGKPAEAVIREAYTAR